ncbi:KilA-N domain-containing protein [Psychroflexus sediminis]|uniref:KilA-N domain-containing protein n=1 Tax=Psychroflexus sediminis TaxID=470826 RepID=A0A1G7YFX7_9FLAO|nr:KilA-N domain-containing protein [Psychroflexus sediminis]SDG95274.1 KilA-N domain-containing protein [Psychroflexus sediminis]
MAKNQKIEVKGWSISLFKYEKEDYISLTDIAKYKDSAHSDTIIQNWLRNRNTIELLGFWESIYNTNFKPLEFEGFKKQAGLNSFVLTPKRWIEATNAVFNNQDLPQSERLEKLNQIAINQMKSLVNRKQIKP